MYHGQNLMENLPCKPPSTWACSVPLLSAGIRLIWATLGIAPLGDALSATIATSAEGTRVQSM